MLGTNQETTNDLLFALLVVSVLMLLALSGLNILGGMGLWSVSAKVNEAMNGRNMNGRNMRGLQQGALVVAGDKFQQLEGYGSIGVGVPTPYKEGYGSIGVGVPTPYKEGYLATSNNNKNGFIAEGNPRFN